MGKTIVEKILSNHSGRDVKSGDFVVSNIDHVMAGDAKGPKAIDIMNQNNLKFNLEPHKTDLIIDHFVPVQSTHWANDHKKLRDFSLDKGINLFDAGSGVCHTIVTEDGKIVPGGLAIGGDSHVCTYGALNCVAVAVESIEIASVYNTGKLWFRVPETIRVNFEGKIPLGVYSKDFVLFLANKLGENGANYQCIEYTGDAISSLSMDARFTISNMSVDMGAKTGIMESDQKTINWMNDFNANLNSVKSDADAKFSREVIIDVSELTPLLAEPPAVHNICAVTDSEKKRIDQAFIGTCTNGRLEDLEIAAKILKGRKINPRVRFYIAPSSRKILQNAIENGVIKTLVDAGATILASACGPCASMNGNGLLGDGDRAISSANRNFPGRLGSKKSEIFLSSPATVAASALLGEITDPREFLS
ncbi:MAG: aconitase/3-isopropylmalate dehydratase large subunit family protein [Nitrospinota bacterium]|nr:aconitase/3-isopropylmalate dehydratase large subunit family protein [Nitrospinota bacterium]